MKLGDIQINANNEVSGFRGKQVIIPIEEYEHLQNEIKRLTELTKDKPCVRVATEFDAYYTLYGDDEYIQIVRQIKDNLDTRMDEWILKFAPNKQQFDDVENKMPKKPSYELKHMIWCRWWDMISKKK